MGLRWLILVVLAALTACSTKPSGPKPVGEAFIGPIEVELREELSPNAKVVGKVKHGDRVDIVGTRRRFVRVRADNGVIGWTDQRRLLTVEQMHELTHLSEFAAKLPSMGKATVYDILNMHSEPNRWSVSFYQLRPNVQVDVLVRKVAERGEPPPPVPIVKPAPPPAKKKREKKEPKVPPVPKPKPPEPPENWLELSKHGGPEPQPDPKNVEPPKPVRLEDWSLVRTTNGKAGWVLSRMLMMSIPDEVAQYSEGARITSYFSLGEVDDDGVRKHNWLWTTTRESAPPYDFDSFRVFIWNRKRDRYETSYIERGVEGHYPVQVEGTQFSVLLRNQDTGAFYRKTFRLDGYICQWLGNSDAAPPRDPLKDIDAATPPPPIDIREPGTLLARFKDWAKHVFSR